MTDWNFTRRLGFAGLGAVGLAAVRSREAAAQGSGGVMDRIVSEKKFKIGYIASPPATIRDPATGELKGFAVDAMRFICKTLNVESVFIETTPANFVSALNSNQFDISIAGTFATILRASAVQFTKPIWYLGYSAVAKTGDTRFSKPSDLNKEGIRIALVQGGASVEYAKENWPKAEHVLLSTGNLTAPFVEVAAGRVDVGVEDAWQARRFALAQPGVTDLFGKEPYNVLPINWAVKRGNQDVVEFMNIAIDFMMTTGRWDKMAEPYGPSGRYYSKPQLSVFEPSA